MRAEIPTADPEKIQQDLAYLLGRFCETLRELGEDELAEALETSGDATALPDLETSVLAQALHGRREVAEVLDRRLRHEARADDAVRGRSTVTSGRGQHRRGAHVVGIQKSRSGSCDRDAVPGARGAPDSPELRARSTTRPGHPIFIRRGSGEARWGGVAAMLIMQHA
ncbi:MAG: hypothetical protein OHK0013_42420 [Sandaracinaceae bacterium]